MMESLSFWKNCLAFIIISSVVYKDVCSDMVSMKIVDEPSSYGLSNSFGGMYQSPEDRLTMRVKPANFSGPLHLKRLVGKCFSILDESYKYEFCPFTNVTQHEQSLRWNPYSGVLGVYQEWEIVNNTFHAMVMREGDACGEIFRSVKENAYKSPKEDVYSIDLKPLQILFKCSNHSHITKVTEPYTCQYHLDFLTPLVCHNHSMLVYPTLSRELQDQWNRLEGELVRGEITKQGYKKKLGKIFEKAGYYLSKERKELLAKPPETKKEEPVQVEEKGEFASMEKCTEEVTKLRAEITQLREALIVHGIKQFETEFKGANPDPEPRAANNHTEHVDQPGSQQNNSTHKNPNSH